MPDLCYSNNEEEYYDDIEVPVDQAIADADIKLPCRVTIYQAEKKIYKHASFLQSPRWFADGIIEQMKENCYDELGEIAEGYLDKRPSDEACSDLITIIDKWAKRHFGDVPCYGIRRGSIKKITVMVNKDGYPED